ncbi:rhodanese-like domain-containing protein [Bernardetia sp.]|uniref:rhodanese-like domain-containing protein n=1 Tax=Bernardetia sp. TaxID=1937974 RepID=UPI0025B96226|nr:rhodanese-like domain-containing protein [Bernardetia sp.]
MIDALKNLFNSKPPTDYKKLLQEGAIIVDVRTKGEYAGGHIKNSKNIPLDTLEKQLSQLKDKTQPIITCCASGMRSGSAKRLLESKGYTNVYNGGGWASLNNKI